MEKALASNDRPVSSENKYGKRYLHGVLEQISAARPGQLYASIPSSTDVAERFKDLSFGDIARCVDNLSITIVKEIGCSIEAETVACLGLPDLRNAVLAAVKCGYKV